MKLDGFEKTVLTFCFLACASILGVGYYGHFVLKHEVIKTPVIEKEKPMAYVQKKKKAHPVAVKVIIPPPDLLLKLEDKDFNNGHFASAYDDSDLIVSHYPKSPEALLSKNNLPQIEKAIQDKASMGFNSYLNNPSWNYINKDPDWIASISNIPAPTPEALIVSKDKNEIENPPPSVITYYKLGVIHSVIDKNGGLYGLALYGNFDGSKTDCSSTTLCQIQISLDKGSPFLVNVIYQQGHGNGALKLSDPGQVQTILNKLPQTQFITIASLDATKKEAIVFPIKGLSWKNLNIPKNKIGNLIQDNRFYQPPTDSNLNLSEDSENKIEIKKQGN